MFHMVYEMRPDPTLHADARNTKFPHLFIISIDEGQVSYRVHCTVFRYWVTTTTIKTWTPNASEPTYK